MASTPPRLKHLTAELLARPGRYAARVVARDRLRRVRLEAPPADTVLQEDALHDFRVALRRLRTWLRAFDREFDDTVGRGTLRRLRRLSRRTGRARDLEVQLLWLSHPTVRLGPLATQAAGALADRLRTEQAAALTTAIEMITEEFPGAGRKLDKQLRRYEVEVRLESGRHEPTMAVTLGRRLREGARQVREALARVTAADQAAEAHRARLAVKHLRYLLESLGEVNRSSGRAAARMARLQDALGVLHDRHVLLARVDRELLQPGAAAASGEATPHPPTRRAFTALHGALERATASEFRKVFRLANAGGTAAALASVDRLAVHLGGEDSPAEAPAAPPEEAAPPPPALDETSPWPPGIEELSMGVALPRATA